MPDIKTSITIPADMLKRLTKAASKKKQFNGKPYTRSTFIQFLFTEWEDSQEL